MRTLIKVGLSLLLLAFVLIGISYSMLRAQGTGNPGSAAGRALGSEARRVGKNIASVELSGPIDLTLRQGLTPSLTVSGEQRLLTNVETIEQGGTLRIGPKGMLFHHRHPLRAELVLPALQQLEVHGNGDGTVNGFSGERFVLHLRGSGNINFNGRFKHLLAAAYGSGNVSLNGGNSNSVSLELLGSGEITTSGNSKLLKAELSGSGDLDAEHLAADRVEVTLLGSGDAAVFAKEAADLTLRGSGNIKVYGSPPQRRSNTTGAGEVSWD